MARSMVACVLLAGHGRAPCGHTVVSARPVPVDLVGGAAAVQPPPTGGVMALRRSRSPRWTKRPPSRRPMHGMSYVKRLTTAPASVTGGQGAGNTRVIMAARRSTDHSITSTRLSCAAGTPRRSYPASCNVRWTPHHIGVVAGRTLHGFGAGRTPCDFSCGVPSYPVSPPGPLLGRGAAPSYEGTERAAVQRQGGGGLSAATRVRTRTIPSTGGAPCKEV